MSVVPLRVSGEAKAKSKDVRGTVNIPYGYRLSHNGPARRNVNLTHGKQSRFAEADDSLRLKNSRKVNKGRVNIGKVSSVWAEGKSPSVEDSSKDGKRETVRETVREKHSLKEEKPVSILPGDPSAANDETRAREDRKHKNFFRTRDFVVRTDKRIARTKFINLVDEGLAEYERSIDARREKLRALLLTEEKSLIREIIDQAQRGADTRIVETQKRTEELRKRSEEQRLATVTEKRMRQYLAGCPEVRDRFARKTTLETKYSNLVQIAEKEAMRQAEREVDVLWYELMLKEVEAKKAREVDEERRRTVAGKSTVATLDKQIAGKLALIEEERRVKEEERAYIERLQDIVRKEESSKHNDEREKRARLKRDLEEQLLVAKRRLIERARDEEAADRSFRVLGEIELARERAKTRESTARLRDEIVAYMTSLEELREEEARRNAEVEAIVEGSAREVEKQRDAIKEKSREVRERIMREVLEGRDRQLRAKRAADEEENARSAFEAELRRKETEAEGALEAEAETKKREMALRYGQELKAQQKYTEEMRRRENEETERMHREDLEREKEYEKLTEQLLNAPEIITPHAFKILLKECAARRAVEQKGLCYRPRSSCQREQTTLPTGHP